MFTAKCFFFVLLYIGKKNQNKHIFKKQLSYLLPFANDILDSSMIQIILILLVGSGPRRWQLWHAAGSLDGNADPLNPISQFSGQDDVI